MVNWKSPRDLQNAAQSLQQRLDDKARAKGEDAADRLLEATRNYGGLWFFVRLPASVLAGSFIAWVVYAGVINKLVEVDEAWMLTALMVFCIWVWYVRRPLKVHPFVELILVFLGFGFGLQILDNVGLYNI